MRAALHDSRRDKLQLPCLSLPSPMVGVVAFSVKRRIFFAGSARGSSRETISRSLQFPVLLRDMIRGSGR